jgi:gas vesicle protein
MANDSGYSLRTVGLACVIGGFVGAAAALLLATQSGREVRKQLRGYARRAEENLHEKVETATEVLDQAVEKGREFIKDRQAVLAEAVEAGRTAMHWEQRQPREKKV